MKCFECNQDATWKRKSKDGEATHYYCSNYDYGEIIMSLSINVSDMTMCKLEHLPEEILFFGMYFKLDKIHRPPQWDGEVYAEYMEM